MLEEREEFIRQLSIFNKTAGMGALVPSLAHELNQPLTVTDNGAGISPEIKSNIFELLRTNKESGMGIGLWLSKTIVESHKGSITFNTALNTGTCFTVRLPIKDDNVFFKCLCNYN